jgi:phospholipase/carboxylesterase
VLDITTSIIDNPALTIIWLHGLGASGQDFMPLVPQLRAHGINANFIFPNAPLQAVSLNQGMQMRAWYDIYTLKHMDNEDIHGMQQSVAAIHELIDNQADPAKVIVAGFSQGGAVAIAAALSYSKPLAGLIAMSTYPSTANSWLPQNLQQPKDLAIMLAHGNWDATLPLPLGQKTQHYMQQWGYNYSWHSYNMGHELCEQEIIDIKDFLLSRI